MNLNNAIESAIQQMRASGLDENTIESYRQQMLMAQQAAQYTAPKFTSYAQPSVDFADEIQKGTQQEMLDAFLGDEEEVIINKNTTLTPTQQWGIACGADLTFLNGYPLNTLEEDVDREMMQEQLSEWWGIENKTDFTEMLDSLAKRRHSRVFELFDKVFKMDTDKGAEVLAENFHDEDEMEVAIEHLDNLAEAYEQFNADGLWKKSTAPNFIVWDLARLINLCRNGFDAGFINEEDALNIIVDSAKRLQKEYKSWRELSIAYQFGRYIWGGNDQYEWLKEGMETLLTHEDSPWVNLDWNMPLV